MLQPVGPLPPQVYWRRRLVLLGGVLVVVLLMVAMCSLGGSSGGSPHGQGTGSPGGGALGGSASPTPSVTSGGASTTITPSPGTAGGPAQGDHPSGSGTPAGSGAPSNSNGSGQGSGSGGDGTQPAGPPQACLDSALDVTASSAQPSYRVGETPVLKLSVRNVGAVACVRDVGPRQQEMLMYDGSKRLWSSNDCYPDGGTDIRTLDPGETVTSTVVWSGLGSQPGCAGKRSRVPAGSYQVTGRVGDLRSKPATLVLR